MKRKYLVFAILLIITSSAGLIIYRSMTSTECRSRTDDQTGYLLKICTYIKEHKIDVSPANPAKYNIKQIEDGDINQRKVQIISLDCCYMGDQAIIDKETGEVISFRVGPK